jgi:hypothetical protein
MPVQIQQVVVVVVFQQDRQQVHPELLEVTPVDL